MNMDVIDEGNDSDGEHGPFLYAVLDELQEGEYKEDVLNENDPAVAAEASESLTEENIVVIIENDKLLKLNVSALKEELKLQGLSQLGLKNIFKYDLQKQWSIGVQFQVKRT